jgi:hypothetical protein
VAAKDKKTSGKGIGATAGAASTTAGDAAVAMVRVLSMAKTDLVRRGLDRVAYDREMGRLRDRIATAYPAGSDAVDAAYGSWHQALQPVAPTP